MRIQLYAKSLLIHGLLALSIAKPILLPVTGDTSLSTVDDSLVKRVVTGGRGGGGRGGAEDGPGGGRSGGGAGGADDLSGPQGNGGTQVGDQTGPGQTGGRGPDEGQAGAGQPAPNPQEPSPPIPKEPEAGPGAAPAPVPGVGGAGSSAGDVRPKTPGERGAGLMTNLNSDIAGTPRSDGTTPRTPYADKATYESKIPDTRFHRVLMANEPLQPDVADAHVKKWMADVVGIPDGRPYTQVEVWGMTKAKKFENTANSDKGPIFVSYVDAGQGSSKGGFMFSTETWRQGATADLKYLGSGEPIPAADRPPISEHMYWAWQDARTMSPGGKDLQFLGSGGIDNTETMAIINAAKNELAPTGRVKPDASGRGNTFEILPTDVQQWNALGGSSAGVSKLYLLTERHTDLGNLKPVKAHVYVKDDGRFDPNYNVIWEVGKI